MRKSSDEYVESLAQAVHRMAESERQYVMAVIRNPIGSKLELEALREMEAAREVAESLAIEAQSYLDAERKPNVRKG